MTKSECRKNDECQMTKLGKVGWLGRFLVLGPLIICHWVLVILSTFGFRHSSTSLVTKKPRLTLDEPGF